MKTHHIIIALLIALALFLLWRTLAMSKQFASMGKASQNPGGKYATHADGSPDYTRYADGTAVMFG